MQVNFGNKKVDIEEKQGMVNSVFSSVSSKYDIMNDIMSAGMHKKWKKDFVNLLSVGQGDRILDLSSGSGDVVELILKKNITDLEITASDINEEMLNEAKKRLPSQVKYDIIDGTDIKKDDELYDFVTLSFGLRNYPDPEKGINEALRVTKKGGIFALMEFSPPREGLFKSVFSFYSNRVFPLVGKFIAKDSSSYDYFAQSIANFLQPNKITSIAEKSSKVYHKDYLKGLVNIYICRKI